MASCIARLRRVNRHNLTTLRQTPLAEISGSLGDLGTLLPLTIALARQKSIHLSSTLVFSGLFNLLTGLFFGIPLPVQPMKAIASAAISSPKESPLCVVIAAGQWVAAAVLAMSLSGLLRSAAALVPIPVLKGIQLGAGLSLILGAGSSLLQPLAWIDPWLDNRLWALAAFVLLVTTQTLPRFPSALCLSILAAILALIQVTASGHQLPALRPWHPHLLRPAWFGAAGLGGPALWMAIGQLPLTTLNSIIAVTALSADLLPEVEAPSVTSVGLSVALMNLSGTWFGAMPVCHGAGGLAAQYRFGARSGASVIILGLVKLGLGLAFGESMMEVLRHHPNSLLGIMVVAAGLELAKVGYTLNRGAPDLWELEADALGSSQRKQRQLTDDECRQRWTVMLTTTAGILAFRNDAVGFLAGLVCHGAFVVADELGSRSRRRRAEAMRRGVRQRHRRHGAPGDAPDEADALLGG